MKQDSASIYPILSSRGSDQLCGRGLQSKVKSLDCATGGGQRCAAPRQGRSVLQRFAASVRCLTIRIRLTGSNVRASEADTGQLATAERQARGSMPENWRRGIYVSGAAVKGSVCDRAFLPRYRLTKTEWTTTSSTASYCTVAHADTAAPWPLD